MDTTISVGPSSPSSAAGESSPLHADRASSDVTRAADARHRRVRADPPLALDLRNDPWVYEKALMGGTSRRIHRGHDSTWLAGKPALHEEEWRGVQGFRRTLTM
jgi:hypothetical protein